MRNLVLASLLLAACGDDGGGSTVDAANGTKALYDSCTADSECMSGICRTFNMPSPGIQVCTQACNASNVCPTQNGTAVTCTNAAVCRPGMAN